VVVGIKLLKCSGGHGGNIVGEALSGIASWLGVLWRRYILVQLGQHSLPSLEDIKLTPSGAIVMVRLDSISLSEYAEFFHRLWPGAGLPARLGKSQLSLGTFFTLALG